MEKNASNNFLVEAAKQHFDSLIAQAFSHASSELSRKRKEFEREETQNGRALFGEGHSARLSVIYSDNLSYRARCIIETVKTVHADFHYPLANEVDQQFLNWAEDLLSNSEVILQNAFNMHHTRFGRIERTISQLNLSSSLAQVTVMNSIRQYFWELRNVPAKKPKTTDVIQSMQVNNVFNGQVANVVIADNSPVNVQQQWSGGDSEKLKISIESLKQALISSSSRQSNQSSVDQALKALDDVSGELQNLMPDQAKITSWLEAIGSAVSAIADIKPAYENVKNLANQLGLSF
jgi:hypothetical protein